jgi:hypothetical protein
MISVSPDTAEIGVPPIVVPLRNLSPGGLGFTHQASMPPGRHVFVWLPQSGAEPTAVRATVRHCQILKQGLYLIGVEFDSLIQFEEPAAP